MPSSNSGRITVMALSAAASLMMAASLVAQTPPVRPNVRPTAPVPSRGASGSFDARGSGPSGTRGAGSPRRTATSGRGTRAGVACGAGGAGALHKAHAGHSSAPRDPLRRLRRAAGGRWRGHLSGGPGSVGSEPLRPGVQPVRATQERLPRSALVGDSYYYQAFALYRHGDRQNQAAARALYAQAAALLAIQAEQHRSAATLQDAAELHVRVESALASAGDSAARASVQERAQEACTDEESSIRAMALSALINMDSEAGHPDASGDRGQPGRVPGRVPGTGHLHARPTRAGSDGGPAPGRDRERFRSEVREAAVFWLSEVDQPAATEALLTIVQSTDDEEMLEGALFALAQNDDPRRKEALRQLARNANAPIDSRATALFWLAESAEDELPFLRRDLPSVRTSRNCASTSCTRPGQVDGQDATDFLREIATDPRADIDALESGRSGWVSVAPRCPT